MNRRAVILLIGFLGITAVGGLIIQKYDINIARFFAAPGNHASIVDIDLPDVLVPGQQVSVSVEVRNDGSTTWTKAGRYHLGSQNPDGSAPWGLTRVPLGDSESIAPGQTKNFTFIIQVPVQPGAYPFRWQMVQDGIEWFGPVSPPLIRIVVQPANAQTRIVHQGGTLSFMSPYLRPPQDQTFVPNKPYVIKKVIFAIQVLTSRSDGNPWYADSCIFRNSLAGNPTDSGREVGCIQTHFLSSPTIRVIERNFPTGLPVTAANYLQCGHAVFEVQDNTNAQQAFACAIVLEEGTSPTISFRSPHEDTFFTDGVSPIDPHTNPGPNTWRLRYLRTYTANGYVAETTGITSCVYLRRPDGSAKWTFCEPASTSPARAEYVSNFEKDLTSLDVRMEPGDSMYGQCSFSPPRGGDCAYYFDVEPVTGSIPAPTVTLSASPNPVAYNTSTRITWSSTNATNCRFAGDDWNFAVPTSQSDPTKPLTANTTYTLTCTGNGGSAAQSVTVAVLPQATPIPITPGPTPLPTVSPAPTVTPIPIPTATATATPIPTATVFPAPSSSPAPTPVISPTLRIDGATSSTRPQLEIFNLTGTKFTPEGTITRYVKDPAGVVRILPVRIANTLGNVDWPFRADCSGLAGTYTVWAFDDATGKKSNEIAEVVVASTACAVATPSPTATATVTSTPTPTPILTPSRPTPSQYSLREGDTVSASGSLDPDIYIISQYGFKRLFLNPVIFGFYGHLGGFEKVKSISPSIRDAFETSLLFRNCETGDQKVYALEATGEDTGTLHHLNIDGNTAVSHDPEFFKKIFCINNNEFNWYQKGSSYTSLNQVPVYRR